MMLFNAKDHARVAAGKLTVTYRLWKKPHVTAGKTYPAGFGGGYFIEKVEQVRAGDITDKEARAAGLPNVQALMALAGEHTKTKVTKATKLTRVRFHFVEEDPRDNAPRLDVDEVLERLARLDQRRPWTVMALRLIEQNPRVAARELAQETWMEKLDFKENIRKLKKLGLTESHLVGYELTELGQQVLDRLSR